MTNTALLATMTTAYEHHAYTNTYIFGFALKGNIYMVKADSSVLPYVLKLDRASRGAGYALRFRPTVAQKLFLLSLGAELICSTAYFKAVKTDSKYNKGEIFEKMITEKFGQVWKKDNTPFYKGADLTTDTAEYQIKFQGATFTNEKQLARLA